MLKDGDGMTCRNIKNTSKLIEHGVAMLLSLYSHCLSQQLSVGENGGEAPSTFMTTLQFATWWRSFLLAKLHYHDKCGGYANINTCTRRIANKALVLTAPALTNFSIRARHNGFGGGIGAFLPLRARKRRHNAGVRNLLV
jgi:hypothetical protein